MSIGSFFKSVEDKATAIVGFIVKGMTFAEGVLGGKSGNAKLDLVVSIMNTVLAGLGIDAKGAETELKAVIDALVALFNKVGVFEKAVTTPTAVPPAK